MDLDEGNRPSARSLIGHHLSADTDDLTCLGGQSYQAPQPAPHLCCAKVNALGG